ncbi:terminase large subunit [Clostridium senegalense]
MILSQLKGYQWAKQVCDGYFIANKWVIAECKRYVDRLEGKHKDCELIEFDFKECETIYKLLKCMNYATGFFAYKPIADHMAGFQAMIWENIFCWFYKEVDENGLRKRVVEEVYLEIGRKSGKSFLCAVTEILILLRSPKFAQTATAGKTRDISSLVKQATAEIIQASPLINKHFKITREKIECKLNNATMKNLSGEANNINGLLLSSYIVDEVANQEDGTIIGALKLSQMNTKDRLSIYISTQYDLEINAFNELLDYHKNILKGVDEDIINTFGLLFELDEGDDFNNEDNWIKASPLQMTMQNGIEFLRGEYKKGLTVPSAMKEFRIKILNEKLSGYDGDTYLDFDSWKKCEVEKINLEGKEVVVSVDASLTTDLTAINIMYQENGKYFLHAHAFLPSNTLSARREKIDYRQMERLGYCTITNGDIVDYTLIEKYIRNIEDKHNCKIKCIVTDPFNIVSTMQKLSEDYEVILLKQSYTMLSPPIKQFRDDVYKGLIYYEKNKLLDWCMSNTTTVEGRVSGDILLNKKNKNKSRIDLVVAAIFGYSQLYLETKEFDVNKYLTDDYLTRLYG